MFSRRLQESKRFDAADACEASAPDTKKLAAKAAAADPNPLAAGLAAAANPFAAPEPKPCRRGGLPPAVVSLRIRGEVLPMHLPREGLTPLDLCKIWEEEWGVHYASSRIKFEVGDGSQSKWMNKLEDVIEFGSEIRLDGNGSVLQSLTLALTQHDQKKKEQAEAAGMNRLNYQKSQARSQAMANDQQERKRLEEEQKKARRERRERQKASGLKESEKKGAFDYSRFDDISSGSD